MLAYERLDVYRSSIELFALCARAISHFPKGNHVLADQLRRAVLSIPLNVAEGVGRSGEMDPRRFFLIARGSTMECGAIMDVCHILGIIDPETDRNAKELIRRIVSMLTRLAKASTTTITTTTTN